MPTQKPRIALTIDEDLDQLLTEISLLQERPKTKLILEFLEDCKPQLLILRDALKAIKNNEKPNPDDILIKLLGSSFQNLSNAFKAIEND